ncbi:MAG: glycosyltransferase [Pseudomonadota bacterium]
MSFLQGGLLLWLLLTMTPVSIAFIVGLIRLKSASTHRMSREQAGPNSPVEIIVPLKGRMPGQENILKSLLEQSYSNYHVIFVVESDADAGNAMVDELCNRRPHARKVISGRSGSCAQKNYGLVEGVRHLRPETEFIVFCDSTNAADPEWLEYFTAPLRSGEAEAVTTFRAFDPRPETLGGVCQAIYASFILILLMLKPKPWGGGTGISRRTFEALNVVDVWSRTVVDDLVLGNILDRAGIRVKMTPRHLLQSPLRGQTIKGFLSYLDRQILFPKFTNPGLWFITLILNLSVTLLSFVSLTVCILFPLGYVDVLAGVTCYGFLAILVTAVLALRRVNQFPVRATRWVGSLLPLLVLSSFVYIRSLVVNHIDWHGRRYLPGKGGVVICTTSPPSGSGNKAGETS